MLTNEFGPWVKHDGLGRPVSAGTVVEVEVECITGLVKRSIGMAGNGGGSAWDWSAFGDSTPWRVLKYRVRKPRGIDILELLVADPLEAVPA